MPLANARGASIIEATAASPRWRDRVLLAERFAEDIAATLAELDGDIESRRSWR
jgi:hypothetical protein